MLEMLESKSFQRLRAEIVGVADLNPNAEGVRLAREKGIYTTNDCAQLFNLERLGLDNRTHRRPRAFVQPGDQCT